MGLKNSHKGMFFSFDALIALSLLLVAFVVVSGIRPGTTQKLSEYQQLHSLSEDAMQIFAGTPFSSLSEPERSEIVAAANLTDADMNKSMLDVVGILWGINKTEYAANMTRDFFSKLLENSSNYSLIVEEYGNVSVIYNSSSPGDKRVLSSSSRVVSGYKENNPNTGYVARAYIIGATKKTQSYAYFGGYEGNGNITKVLVLPNGTEDISEVYLEMDAPSNFTLFINGALAGAYNVTSTTPLRAKNWTVSSAYYPNFINGSNNITLSFPDINSAYIGGGFIRVTYNTTVLDTSTLKINPDGNITDRYYFPGIDGLINLYSSFYVPGMLKSLGVRLHYRSNYTVYLIIGNVSVYENSTNNTQTIYLNSTFLSSTLNSSGIVYSTFNTTMPIRFGTKNITGLGEGSDVVLITDLSGSMSTCDVNASASPPDCNNPGIKHNRIYAAKESDRQFVLTVLANDGQRMGLIAYNDETITSRTEYLTNNATRLNNTINAYATGGMTCISCGIQSSTDMLKTTLDATKYITNKSQWAYNDSFLFSAPPLDSEGRNWTHQNYSLGASWATGNAVFGNGTYNVPLKVPIPIDTGIRNDLSNVIYPDLWDMAADKSTPETDFTSGMNHTGPNTFGLGAGYDGWDVGARYDYSNTVTYYNASGGALVIATQTGSPPQNRCTSYDCSGGYGIQINITPQMYSTIASGGVAYITFNYSWKPNRSSSFEDTDEVWIKGNWTSPTSGGHPLGREMSNEGNDRSPEIDKRNHPRDNTTGYLIQNITGWIEGAGMYYLDFGGKLQANAADENGNFSFDNVLLEISNTSNTMYFRKSFNIPDISSVKEGVVKILADDGATIYLNGAMVLNDTDTSTNMRYWKSANTINHKYFNEGENVVAVMLYNSRGPARFDLELITINDSRNKAMLVMSDGEANTLIDGSTPSVEIAADEAINRSCYAYETYGIISHSVGFGNDVDAPTLQAIAACGHGNYYSSNDEDELKEIYRDIANSIISYTTQAAEISGETAIATLYTDSFIEYNYTPAVDISYGDISLAFESNTFGNTSGNYSIESPKNGSYNISSNMVVVDAKATSYSSDYWTSILEAKNESGAVWIAAFNLSAFGTNYGALGDPYIVNIPVQLITPGGLNYVRINTAKNASELTGGSPDNRIIYSVRVKGSVDYGETFNTSEEALANATWRLSEYLKQFGISVEDINTGTIDIGRIPWMWGPATMTLEVWKE